MDAQVVVRLLPDGSGRVCIHWLYRNPKGKIETADNIINTSAGPKILSGTRWTMACNPELGNISQRDGHRIIPWVHSDDPRAVTCPRCMETAEFKEAMKKLEATVPTGG